MTNIITASKFMSDVFASHQNSIFPSKGSLHSAYVYRHTKSSY